jgi:hypothetical protein
MSAEASHGEKCLAVAWKPPGRVTRSYLNFFRGFEYEPAVDCVAIVKKQNIIRWSDIKKKRTTRDKLGADTR